MGEGLPVGQTGMQMFNFSQYINGDAAQQKTRTEEVFAMLQSKGVRVVEPYSLHGMTATEFRALADKYQLHIVGRHGSALSDANTADNINTGKTLGQQFVGSGGTASPGQGTYAQTLATAAQLNRSGKLSVEAGTGKAYIHNHTAEFETKYEVNGVVKSAWEILMDNTDPRYVMAEVDAGWATDAPVDVVDLLTRYRTRIEMMHVKDLTNIAPAGRSGQPVQLGTGEIDYGRIFAAAKNSNVKWYHYELDPPNAAFPALQTARNSFDAIRGAAAPALYASSPKFNVERTVATAAASTAASVPVKVENLGDAALNITAVSIAAQTGEPTGGNGSTGDFTITSNTCTTGAIPAAVVGQEASSCTVFVRFNPRRAYTTSIARLQFTSNSDAATNSIQLVGTSGQAADPQVVVGGNVTSQLGLDLTGPAALGTFVPGTAADYTSTLLAEVTTTTPDAKLSVLDNSATAAGHLVNGTAVLRSPLKLRATNATQTSAAFTALSETTGTPLDLLSYTAPTTRDRVSIGIQQSIGATETLLRGTYSKTLTFSVSSTTP
ncbi:sugar phosphate isomerase/epimerase [Solirubrobacter phytolaccae]|uniref:Sugar phosphate isomerase/epimerase n=1 Tax=Solirubrobacter phytolaccae TaxID=1404360 RepID=A0A9X3NND3_9ACTN|nr:sugar phosphate isomerase/epimerase [Solirubrobacter phytolaccae]MDA0184587.1 sugar phosphate isomerase/epimerase [Solirubrobacter phytolaccae]